MPRELLVSEASPPPPQVLFAGPEKWRTGIAQRLCSPFGCPPAPHPAISMPHLMSPSALCLAFMPCVWVRWGGGGGGGPPHRHMTPFGAAGATTFVGTLNQTRNDWWPLVEAFFEEMEEEDAAQPML